MDVTTVLAATALGGTATIAQQIVGWFREERRKDHAEARTEATAPVERESKVLVVADQAVVIQQRSIKRLEEELAQVQLEVGTLRTENTSLREQMAAKDKEIQGILDAKDRELARLYTRIGKLEVEIDHLGP
jgi:predicted RNase H-like nuclease (RuvC/YqgF family)